MKKSIYLLVFAFLSIVSFAQSNTIPSSVRTLGQKAVDDYLQLTNITGTFEVSVFTSQTKFETVNELVSASYKNWRDKIGDVEDEATIINLVEVAINALMKSGGDYSVMISESNFSQNLSNIFQSIISQAIRIQEENDLNDILLPYAVNIDQQKLTSDEKSKLKSFIVAYNANFDVIVKSKILESKLSVSGGEAGRRWWQVLLSAVQCALGTTGGAILGGLAGAAVGTVTLPVIGTVSGAVIGFWGGAMAGASQSCF